MRFFSTLKVRFAFQYISAAKKLPTKQDMLEDMHIQTQIHWNKGYPKRNTHLLGPEQAEYYKQLSETAGIENIPSVLPAMHNDSRQSMAEDSIEFRKYKYIVIDDKTFRKERIED